MQAEGAATRIFQDLHNGEQMKLPDVAADATALRQPPQIDGMRSHGRFFVIMAALMLLINLVGFAPSYYLKVFFDRPELPLRTHIHGPLFTAWFILLLAQTSLIARRRIDVHRCLGILGVVLATAMVATGLVMIYFRALEYQDPGRSLAGTAQLVWADSALLLSFVAFVGLGVRFRHRAEAHKRLMLLASLSMMPLSLGRYLQIWIPMLLRMDEAAIASAAANGRSVIVIAGVLCSFVLLLLAPVFYDLFVHRRVHPVNVWGMPLFFAFLLFCVFVVPSTSFGQALILSLG
jgi:hypothetical protein